MSITLQDIEDDDWLRGYTQMLFTAESHEEVFLSVKHLLAVQSGALQRLAELAEFGKTVLDEHQGELGDIDGGWIQDTAERIGLLVRVEVTEPCGENCQCAECGDFPQECLRRTDTARAP